MALHLILQRARWATDPSEIRIDLIEGIDAHANGDDWDGPPGFLFQDHDVLTLFDDDVETHSGAVNLEPDDWFTRSPIPNRAR